MKLTLLSPREYTTTALPEKCAGSLWVRGRGSSGRLEDIVAVEAVREDAASEPRWVLKSNRHYRLLNSQDEPVQNVPLVPSQLYLVESTVRGAKFVLYAEPLTADRRCYTAYEVVGGSAEIAIGRESGGITYNSRFVSQPHAVLTITPQGVSVRDAGSGNHTYLNGRAVREAALKNGDALYIMGLQIIVTRRFVYLNDPDGKVEVRCPALRKYHPAPPPPVENQEEDEFEEVEEDYYYRAPRFRQDTGGFLLKVDPPPTDQNKDEMPLIMVIGPSMTMGMASVATGVYAVANALSRGDISSAIPSIVMSLSMLLGTLMWPLITRSYQRRLRRRREEARQTRYQAYLEDVEKAIRQESARQEDILRKNDVSTAEYVSRVLAQPPKIWERTRKHADFLCLRLGYGDLPLDAELQFPERRFTIEEDNLAEAMYRMAEKQRWLRDVPVCLNLVERFISGVYAERRLCAAYAKSLILQIAALHGYDEVKIVLICSESDESAFARWLPHTMNQERTVRYLATNYQEAKALSSVLDPIIEYRKALGEEKLADEAPYFAVICLDKELAARTECVRRIQEHKKNLGFSVLSVYERLQDLPKECSAVVRVGGSESSLTLIDDVSRPPAPFRADAPEKVDLRRVVQVLANTEIDAGDANYTFPSQYTFFEMLDVGMIEHLNLLERWSANDPTASLAAAVGVDKYGESFKLDLHERAHGPHGLIAGMTGSGKSEFIIAYILSMAVSFHPNEVAFVLIDYKGGGMAESFKSIPHTAGIITNLDGNNGITRSLASLNSELHRRERIFGEVSQRCNVSNIDIYKYQKLYREGRVTEPLPHLLIVSDEFAELKKEQPEFMNELTSTARVGRSLGVHLILATQKPGGVVDDQIRSNSRFRVCLKVQDNGDSMEMLGRPEAAALVDTGRFYLQVGNNELFEIGQSAWAGAPYYPSARTIRNRDDAVQVVDTNGRVVASANTDRYASYPTPPKQVDVVTGYIRKVCEDEGIGQWKMWLDPLPEKIYVDALAERYGGFERGVLAPVIGEADDPAHQSQYQLRLPISEGGNAVVYGSAGSGKTMFLEAVCYSLMREHTPDEVNLYILDFNAETMKCFAAAPHVGEVIFASETEKVQNLFKLLLGKLGTRKSLLSASGGSLRQYNAQAEKPEPEILVIINNYAAFVELFEDRTGDVSYLTREGVKYGITFLVACTGINDVKFSLRQNFSTLYCLQLNNTDDYASIVGKTGGLYPEKYKGRGLLRLDKNTVLEFQTASVTEEEPSFGFLSAFAEGEARRYAGARAARVPVLPEEVTEEFLLPGGMGAELSRLPVGVEKASLEIAYFDFTESPVTLVLSMNQEWQALAGALERMIRGRCGVETVVLAPNGKKAGAYTDLNGCVEAVRRIFAEVLRRNNTYKDALEAGRPAPEYEPLVVAIESMSQLRGLLGRWKPAEGEKKEASDDTPLTRLLLAMEKNDRAYGVYFLVGESLNLLTPSTTEGWYKAHVTGSRGIWAGSGIGSQYRLTVSNRPQEGSAGVSAGFGYTIESAAAKLVKFVQ